MDDLINMGFFVCPDCRKNISQSGNILICNNCQNSFEIIDDIPVLLPLSSGKNKYNMDYIEHYKNDAEHFDYFAPRDFPATEHDERRLREYILSLVPKNSKMILDVGSGGGWAAKELLKKNLNHDTNNQNLKALNDNFDTENRKQITDNTRLLISFDISFKNVKTGLSSVKHSNHYGVVGDALHPPFDLNSFDCIIASEVIEHVVEPSDFVKSLMQLLKPGGCLIISTPYNEILLYYQCIHCNQLTPKNAHLHSFDEIKLQRLYIDGDMEKYSHYIFGNKALAVLRTHIILKFLNLSFWKLFDKIANLILNKPAHIIAVYKKKVEHE